MQTCKNSLSLLWVITCFGVTPCGRLPAQTVTTLYSFTPNTTSTNADGSTLSSSILSGDTLYGTAVNGGSSGYGTLFSLRKDGTAFTIIHMFSGGSDGASPLGLALFNGKLYGAAFHGGSSLAGTVFAVNTDGSGFTTLHSFNGDLDGAYPDGVILSGDILYGTSTQGGSAGLGNVFAVAADGTSFTNLHSFTGSDGAYPSGLGSPLVLSNNFLYGTTTSGGGYGGGSIFKVGTDGSGFSVLHSFTQSSGISNANDDGFAPQGRLILSGDTLYGAAAYGGAFGNGTVFKIATDGIAFTTLHHFSGTNDGANPLSGLILSGTTLFGTAWVGGGATNRGVVFALNIDGTHFRTLHSFSMTDGVSPMGGLSLSGGTLYGTATSLASGTIFSISLPLVALQIALSGTGPTPSVILTWPTSATGLTLQSATNVFSTAWTAIPTAPVVVNGLNTVTNPISGPQQFFRLNQ
jgi:uncharacterized repeat protein (TIGR03803 family)